MSTKSASYDFTAKQAQYRGYSADQLRYALADAADARDATRGHDIVAENWYADDVHTIAAEMRAR